MKNWWRALQLRSSIFVMVVFGGRKMRVIVGLHFVLWVLFLVHKSVISA